MDVDVQGVTRSVTVVGEPGDEGPRALVLVFHGSNQDGQGHRAFTGNTYDQLVEQGAVVAYLDGYQGNWNDARRHSAFPARTAGMDDIGFARAVVDALVTRRGIDRHRVFAVGFSNGGQMVLRLIHEAPELVAGAAVIAATMPAPEDFLVPDGPAVPMPVLLVHGTKDRIVPYRGGEMSGWARRLFKVGGRSLSMPQTAAHFAARNGISAEPVRATISGGGRGRRRTWVERTRYAQDASAPVDLYTVHGGGHTVPGPRRAPFVLGATHRGVSTADLVSAFFGLGG
ncbi:alpha/beta hydrolase family esterase [Cellulomonas chengniuliangii]|uniref:Prolyl oligopeptidase family serine peptidase n=1 Tax=Cellulomonas chengniuliangii TaxID=2968084 RepID=A0ABY5KZS0_9CELL|nr:prolyl oligopeptidase family serine peptidase [Cellulomonas chengniuliangii]MCC2307186.1 prolyl oligopeptidase family serine peptidase [Cellulomonas chengniuliangii]UUI76017.1 prolyl oligopeptidase family serine peptidase [Cellulomonas chengniuliangii]